MSIHNYDLDIKRTFLSFAQHLFAEDPKYTWTATPSETKVLIVDKYAINLNVLEKKRSIVLSRGTHGWSYRAIGQLKDAYMVEPDRKTYTDLIRGSVVYNCIAQNGLIAEHLAHKLFAGLAAFKDQFRKQGIHSLQNISIGEETILKSDSSIELTTVPIFVQFETQKEFRIGYDHYTFYLEDQDSARYYQGSDFKIDNAGITFYEAPLTGTTFTATYVNGITLEEVVEPLIGTVNGTNTSFAVSYPIYGEYPIWSGIETTYSGITAW